MIVEYSKHSKYTASVYTVYITYKLNSLIPRPSFLTTYSMPKRKGKAWSIYYVNDINVYLPSIDRGGKWSLTVRMSWKPFEFVQALEFQMFA